MEQQVFVGLFLTFVIISCGMIFQKSKLYLGIQVIWILILMCFNTNNVDFFGNSNLYYTATNSTIFREGFFMGGYYFFSVQAKALGLSYIQFNGIMVAICIGIIMYVTLKFSNNPCIVMSFFMLYPLASSIIQKRWFLAMGLLILAVSVWAGEKNTKLKKTIIYLILVGLACQIHTGSLFFVSLAIFFWVPDKYKKTVAVIGLIVMSVFSRQLSLILENSDNTGVADKSEFYFSTIASNNVGHYIFWFIWQLFFILLIFYLLRNNNIKNILGEKYSYFLWVINLWSLLIIPLYSFDPVFSRFFRVVAFFDYIAISNIFVMKNFKVLKVGLFANTYQFLLSLSSFIIFNVLAGAPFHELIYPLFNNNIILNAIK